MAAMATGEAAAGSTASSGYPVSIIDGAVDPRYLCGFCKCILKQPTQSFCGHRFCKGCIDILISPDPVRGVPCPQCKEENIYDEDPATCTISKDKIYPDNALNRDLRKLSVKCINPGCDWKGKFSQYEAHLPKCKWQPARCRCGKELAADQFDEHELTECILRLIPCQFCKQGIVFADYQSHLQVCSSRPSGALDVPGSWELVSVGTLCPFGCNKILNSLQEQQNHYLGNHVDHTSRVLRLIKQLESLLASRAGTSSLPSRESEETPPQSIEQAPPPAVRPPTAASHQQVPAAASGATAASLSGLQEGLRVLEDTVAVVVNEVNRDEEAIKKLERQRSEDRDSLTTAENKIKTLERTLTLKDITIAELDLRVQYLENTNYNGSLMWRINEFSRRRQEAISGKTTSIYSPTFHTSRTGYKMCARIYLNGDGIGKGTHVSLFFVLLRGTYDALLPWPFRQKVTFKFVDQNQRDHVVDAFRPDPTSTSFQRPKSEMNIASGCPLFMPLTQLDNPQQGFIKDNTAFIHITVDLAGLDDF